MVVTTPFNIHIVSDMFSLIALLTAREELNLKLKISASSSGMWGIRKRHHG